MYTLKKYNNCGSRSKFYTLEDKKNKGFKTFIKKEHAEQAREVQIELAKYDLAPRVYSEVGRIRIGKNKKQFSDWGYVTEIAILPGCGGNDCECGNCGDLESDLNDEICDLTDGIESLGYYFPDNHIGNVGYVRRKGRKVLVCIDTGYESVQCADECYNEYDEDYNYA
jgi:hypothetical protein